MSPTYDPTGPRFRRDLDRLTDDQLDAFRVAVGRLVEDLRRGEGFRAGLRVKRVKAGPGVWEMTWAPDGRATFTYGEEIQPGQPHIVWRRVGTHDIFRQP